MDDFLAYVAAKRQNAVWGDDPEVQALCELYDRPAEIWAYEAQHGARKLRTFHENCGESRQRPPMRLSYYGGGHYDSVVSLAEPVPSAPRPVAGELEDAAIKRAELRKRMAGGVELGAPLRRRGDRAGRGRGGLGRRARSSTRIRRPERRSRRHWTTSTRRRTSGSRARLKRTTSKRPSRRAT